MAFHTIQWDNGVVRMLDQRLLPAQIVYNDYTEPVAVADAIRSMVIRGAPAIGAAAAYGLALVPYKAYIDDVASMRTQLHEAAVILRASRPTAVNLFWAIDRMMERLDDPALVSVELLAQAAIAEANAIAEEDVEINKQMGRTPRPWFPMAPPSSIIVILAAWHRLTTAQHWASFAWPTKKVSVCLCWWMRPALACRALA